VERHRFVARPHATLLALTLPVLASLLLEPLTGLVDTFFVARLGTLPLGALGIATALLSSVIWVFNFVGIGAQTEVARADGAGDAAAAADAAWLAIALGAALGGALAVLASLAAPAAVAWMGAEGEMIDQGVSYLRIRLLAAPALLASLAAFGALRGRQDMRTPLRVAIVATALNAGLDPLLIFGAGPLPGQGVAGAAVASSIAHWVAALYALFEVRRRIGGTAAVPWRHAPALLVVGRDLVLRSALLLGFQLLATREAALIGASGIAAHHAVRQLWLIAVFGLDAYAAAAQSLAGYFLGARRVDLARRVASVSCGWGAATGLLIGAAMLGIEDAMARGFVPVDAQAAFRPAWRALAFAQVLGALSFVTDGLHWASRDYAFLRNAMLLSTACGLVGLWLVDPSSPDALLLVWIVTGAWMGVRAGFGVARIWPGFGRSPYVSS
jgi:MATE family multidrug resistance protein